MIAIPILTQPVNLSGRSPPVKVRTRFQAILPGGMGRSGGFGERSRQLALNGADRLFRPAVRPAWTCAGWGLQRSGYQSTAVRWCNVDGPAGELVFAVCVPDEVIAMPANTERRSPVQW